MANPCLLRVEVARGRLHALGMTQTMLAERSGHELRTLQRWFAGGRVGLEDAERLAAACGLGTAELFEGVPELGVSPFTRLRSLLSWIRLRESELGHAIYATLENFDFIDSFVEFSSHPAHGFVHRILIEPADRHGFLRLRVEPRRTPTRLSFGGQVARRFRYLFGEVEVGSGAVVLVESFHTRSSMARRRPDGSFDLFAWIGRDMRELVVVSDQEVDVTRLPVDEGKDASIFDLADGATAHAVCFRPSAMHLRDAGFSAAFDRVRGSRDARIDALAE